MTEDTKMYIHEFVKVMLKRNVKKLGLVTWSTAKRRIYSSSYDTVVFWSSLIWHTLAYL